MTDRHELDDALRSKLQSLVEDAPPLPMAARVRTLRALEQEARQQNLRRLRFRRVATAMAIAAGFALMVRYGASEPESARAPRTAARAPTTACPLPSTDLAFTEASGTKLLDLGELGALRAEPGAEVQVVRTAACAVEVELDRGMLAAELKDLPPGALTVRTPLGNVRAGRTTFSVRADRQLEVVAAEGPVDVVEGEKVTALAAGQVLRRADARAPVQIAPHSPEQIRALWTLLSAESYRSPDLRATEVASERSRAHERRSSRSDRSARGEEAAAVERDAQPTAGELLARAEAERKLGRADQARASYAAAAALDGLDAEVAALRLVRLELEVRDAARARDALAAYRGRYAVPRFEAEAAWLAVRTHEVAGEKALARELAGQIVRRFPNSAQARAAQSYLAKEP